nr:hypothetical protein [Tanacetum cinerariifolium]
MDIRDEMVASKHKLKIDSSSIQGGLVKHKKNSSMGNDVFQPNLSRNTKSSIKRLSKEVVKPKGALVKFNVGKRKRFVEDKEVEADVEGNESEADESKKANESEEAEKIKEDKESEVAKELVKDVKTKVVKGKGKKGNNKRVVSKAKKR